MQGGLMQGPKKVNKELGNAGENASETISLIRMERDYVMQTIFKTLIVKKI